MPQGRLDENKPLLWLLLSHSSPSSSLTATQCVVLCWDLPKAKKADKSSSFTANFFFFYYKADSKDVYPLIGHVN